MQWCCVSPHQRINRGSAWFHFVWSIHYKENITFSEDNQASMKSTECHFFCNISSFHRSKELMRWKSTGLTFPEAHNLNCWAAEKKRISSFDKKKNSLKNLCQPPPARKTSPVPTGIWQWPPTWPDLPYLYFPESVYYWQLLLKVYHNDKYNCHVVKRKIPN